MTIRLVPLYDMRDLAPIRLLSLPDNVPLPYGKAVTLRFDEAILEPPPYGYRGAPYPTGFYRTSCTVFVDEALVRGAARCIPILRVAPRPVPLLDDPAIYGLDHHSPAFDPEAAYWTLFAEQLTNALFVTSGSSSSSFTSDYPVQTYSLLPETGDQFSDAWKYRVVAKHDDGTVEFIAVPSKPEPAGSP